MELFAKLLDDLGQGLYRWLLRCIRWFRLPVLAMAVAMILAGIYLSLLEGVQFGWVVSLGGLLVAVLNLGTWRHVERFTRENGHA